MLKKRILHNGGPNLHILQNAQGCQDGIKRTLNIDPSKISKQQNNVVRTVNPGFPVYIYKYIYTKEHILRMQSVWSGHILFLAHERFLHLVQFQPTILSQTVKIADLE